MNILVTGGSGTLGGGYVLPELLRAGHTVSDYSRTAPLTEGVRFIQGDIADLDRLTKACSGHDAIVHLAAVPGPGRATPEQLMYVNVIGTVNVLEAAVKAGVSKFVFASSGAATGFCFQRHEIVPQYFPLDEEHPCEPQDEYGLSKLLGELTCKRYSHAYGLQTICLRIANNWYLDEEGTRKVLGRGWAKDMSTMEELWKARYYKTIKQADGHWPIPGPPSPKNVLWVVTDARDAAQAFRLAVENDTIAHEVLFINGDDTCSDEKTEDLIRKHYPNVPLKSNLKDFASLVSHERATRVLGYKPQYTWRKNSKFTDWLESFEVRNA